MRGTAVADAAALVAPLAGPAAGAMFQRADGLLGADWTLRELRHTAACRTGSAPVTRRRHNARPVIGDSITGLVLWAVGLSLCGGLSGPLRPQASDPPTSSALVGQLLPGTYESCQMPLLFEPFHSTITVPLASAVAMGWVIPPMPRSAGPAQVWP